jgi:Zn-dependent protease/CBS domain-containing protein
MENNLRLGRIFGIEVALNWSLIFIFVLIAWNLAIGVFAQLHPEWNLLYDWGLAIIATVLFFVSLLAHELAHSLVAKAQGLPVRSITLWLFGGVSSIEKQPRSPGAEFLMAIVGPLTSIVLGAIFLLMAAVGSGGLGTLASDLALLGPVTTLLLWLGSINILLGIFNLVPGFPLDGGRVLRSIFWAVTHNLRTATRWASWAGQGVAWLLILTGIAMVFGIQVPIFGSGLIGGLWLVLIGWFLHSAAVQSYQQMVIEGALKGIPVSRMMEPDVPTVLYSVSVSTLVNDYIMKTRERAFPVMQDGQLVGIVSLEDVRKVPQEAWNITAVHQIMTPKEALATATPDEDVNEALTDLTNKDVNQVPVVQNGHVVGMLRRSDILRWLQVQSEITT